MKKINGYESIDYLYGYISKNYRGAELLEENSIDLDNFIQDDFEYDVKNCSLVSITRLIKFYSRENEKLPKDELEIYRSVFNIAKGYKFSYESGTSPLVIDDIIRDYFNFYGVEVKSKGHYLGNFYNPVKKEIDKRHPLIMNIAFGKYQGHTVTVSGYKIFKFKNMKIKFIELFDGWSKNVSYLDYNIFAHGIMSVGVCSYNTIELK